MTRLAPLLVLLLAIPLAGCGGPTTPGTDPEQVDALEVPELGACRVLTLRDVAQTSDATETVPCSEEHTAQTYAVGELPDTLREAAYDAPEVGAFAFDTCSSQLEKFLGGDVSVVMRSIITWAWFRPSPQAWEDGARWYRCDAVGGGEQSATLASLPETARGLLQGRPDDRWMACVEGASIDAGPTIPCSETHDWRAVTTIKLGEPADPYPGDRVVEVRTRSFCSDSVGAWLNYPVDFDYGFTWFHQAEWDAGNRRSICWAKTGEWPHRSARAASVAVALLILVGCSDDGSPADDAPGAAAASQPGGTATATPTPTPAPSPPATATEAPRPSRDSCHRLDFEEALAPTAGLDAVACRKRHTSETYAVGRVDALADGHLLAVDSARVQRQVAATCPAALPEAVGGSLADLRLSMLRAVWFTPTVEESDAGADWYRCDVVALAGAEQLLPVTGSLAGVLDSPEGRERYGMCGTAGPDDERFERLPCSEPHSWRAFQVIDLPAGPYPGRAAIAAAGSAPCQDAAAAAAADPLDYEWGFEGPDADQWAAGQTFVRCWAPD